MSRATTTGQIRRGTPYQIARVTRKLGLTANILFSRQIHPDCFVSQTLQTRSLNGQNDRDRFTEHGEIDTEYFAMSTDRPVLVFRRLSLRLESVS